jgi:hypothetical protein
MALSVWVARRRIGARKPCGRYHLSRRGPLPASGFRPVDPGDVLMRAGRPVLVVPDGARSMDAKRIVLGWKGPTRSPPRMSRCATAASDGRSVPNAFREFTKRDLWLGQGTCNRNSAGLSNRVAPKSRSDQRGGGGAVAVRNGLLPTCCQLGHRP